MQLEPRYRNSDAGCPRISGSRCRTIQCCGTSTSPTAVVASRSPFKSCRSERGTGSASSTAATKRCIRHAAGARSGNRILARDANSASARDYRSSNNDPSITAIRAVLRNSTRRVARARSATPSRQERPIAPIRRHRTGRRAPTASAPGPRVTDPSGPPSTYCGYTSA